MAEPRRRRYDPTATLQHRHGPDVALRAVLRAAADLADRREHEGHGDLFSTFGLWFGERFSLFDNVVDVFTIRDGAYLRWTLNSALYAGVSAIGATLFATMAGCLRQVPLSRIPAAVQHHAGAIMIPPRRSRYRPTCCSRYGLVNTPSA